MFLDISDGITQKSSRGLELISRSTSVPGGTSVATGGPVAMTWSGPA
jgi:hypothetical protein